MGEWEKLVIVYSLLVGLGREGVLGAVVCSSARGGARRVVV